MDFKNWVIEEGWSIDLSNIPFDELRIQLQGRSKDAVKWLLKRARFNYQGKQDLPSDFIKVVPLNKMKELPSLQLKQYLPSFEGVRIYYGYTFDTPHNYKDKYAAWTPRANPTQTIDTAIKQLMDEFTQGGDSDYRVLYEPIARDEVPPRKIRAYIDDNISRIINTLVNMNSLTYQARSHWMHQENPFGQFEDEVVNGPIGHNYYTYLYKKYYQSLLQVKNSMQSQFTTKDDASRYLNVIKIAFSKALKEPVTPQGKQNTEVFIKQAADNFYRVMGNRQYQYVFYPQSSKQFNKEFAEYLGKLYGVPAIQGFNKMPAGQVTLDEPALQSHYPDDYQSKINTINQGTGIAGHSGLSYYQNKRSDEPLQIKKFPQQYRRYIKMWQPMDKANRYFTNKRMLIVDDNVDQGGTLERLYDLVIKYKPKAVDIYTPLYIGGGHGVTH